MDDIMKNVQRVYEALTQTPSKISTSNKHITRTPIGNGAQIYTANQILARDLGQNGHPDISTLTDKPGILNTPNDGGSHNQRSDFYFRNEGSDGSMLDF